MISTTQEKAASERWFCTSLDDLFFTDDYQESIRHQYEHSTTNIQIRCIHKPLCNSLYEHKQKTGGEENW
jgi:hypothetical protein